MYVESQSNQGVPFTNTCSRVAKQRPKHVLKCVKPGKPGVFVRIKPGYLPFCDFFFFFPFLLKLEFLARPDQQSNS